MAGRILRGTLVALVFAGAALSVPHTLWAEEQVVIYTTGVLPGVLKIKPEERVLFVNRTGKTVHVEFPEASDRHHVFQVPDQIWAVFHSTGRHPYVVHLTDGPTVELRGAVDVESDPRGRSDSQPCNGVTVLGTCLQR